MKRLIALSSIGLSIGFALALANAEDTTSSSVKDSGQSSVYNPRQEAGTAGTPSYSESNENNTGRYGSAEISKDTETREKSDKMSSATTCVDDKGATYKQGSKEYKDCMKSHSKTKGSEQMGGQAPDDFYDEHLDDINDDFSS